VPDWCVEAWDCIVKFGGGGLGNGWWLEGLAGLRDGTGGA